MTTSTPPALLNLADLSQRIAIRDFYESHGCIVSGKPTNSHREGREYACSCFVCGGTDRASFWDSGRFCCVRGCRAKASSPYWFLRDIQGFNHIQALEELGIDQEELGDSYSQSFTGNKLPLFLVSDEPPNKKWQEAAMGFCRACEHVLWSDEGKSAREYLHSRGFKDDTIKQARLGLCYKWHEASLEDWGLSAEQLGKEDDPRILISRSIILPYYVDGSIHKIQRRTPDGLYFEVLGSTECLYLPPGQQIEDRPVLLVESELDALAAHQEASDIICCVATGGTPKGRNPRNLTQLHQASKILQAFDDDPAGEKAAAEWQELIPGIIRHTPWSHDVNDMLKEEMPIRAWVELGLSNGEPEQGETLEAFWEAAQPPALDKAGKEILLELIQRIPNLVERLALFQSGKKICCDTPDWEIDADGYLICPCVTKARNENRLLDIRIAQEKAGNRSPVDLDW